MAQRFATPMELSTWAEAEGMLDDTPGGLDLNTDAGQNDEALIEAGFRFGAYGFEQAAIVGRLNDKIRFLR